jgi:hypothetical protein
LYSQRKKYGIGGTDEARSVRAWVALQRSWFFFLVFGGKRDSGQRGNITTLQDETIGETIRAERDGV